MIVTEPANSSGKRSFFFLTWSNCWRRPAPATKIPPMSTHSMTLASRYRRAFPAALALLTAAAWLACPRMAPAGPASGIDSALSRGKSQSSEPDFLPPDEAFRFSALADGPDKIRLIWGITDGYYLYRARLKASSDSDQAKLGELVLPTGETKVDDYFGKQEVYHHDIVGSISVARSGAGQLAVPLKVTYQGCATAGLCYPPITKTVSVVLPPAGGSASSASGGGLAPGAGTTASGSASASGSAPAAASTGALADGAAATINASAGSTVASAGAFVSEQDQLATLIR